MDLQTSRNWAMEKACELINFSPEFKNKTVEIVWKVTDTKLRQITVNSKVVFVQGKDKAKGIFKR